MRLPRVFARLVGDTVLWKCFELLRIHIIEMHIKLKYIKGALGMMGRPGFFRESVSTRKFLAEAF